MKKILLPVLVFALMSFGMLTTGITDSEREHAVKDLTKTHDRLTTVIEGLSEAQLNFKAAEGSWSVGDCLEHIAISENAFDGMLKGALQTPANPAMRDSVTMSDEKLVGFITSREQKVKTSEAFEPSGKFGSHAETLESFVTKRKEHIAYIKATTDDLRNHYGKLPFATLDGYQIILFMSGHTERHVQQMEEVMANENFPSE